MSMIWVPENDRWIFEVLQKQHVATQLTKRGGPEPLSELQRIYDAARDEAQGACWIATRKPGVAFVQGVDSRMLAFARQGDDVVSVLTGKIDSRTTELPDDPMARDLYGDFRDQFRAFWRLRDVELASMPMKELPGKTLKSGVPLSRAFKGNLSFAYWQPPAPGWDSPLHIAEGPALEGESLDALVEEGSAPTPLPPAMDSQEGFLSAASAATLLGVAKSTVAQRVARNEVVGFHSSNGTLRIPSEQFTDGVVIEGVPDVLAMFTEESSDGRSYADHRGAWGFLCTSLYPGDSAPRPLDRLKARTRHNALSAVVAELARVKESLDYGDHV